MPGRFAGRWTTCTMVCGDDRAPAANGAGPEFLLQCPSRTGIAEGHQRTPLGVTEMRIWSIHPKYLDPPGLLGLWREGLLAQKVLCGLTKGYRNHPQLIRFRRHRDAASCVAQYLKSIYDEALRRGYRFDRNRILPGDGAIRVTVTRGQLLYEWRHLQRKLAMRNPKWYKQWCLVTTPQAHPLFVVVPGRIEAWERVHET